MAQYFAPPDAGNPMYGILGGVLGGLGGYAMSESQKPAKIKQFESFGASPEQARALASAPESTQTAWLRESMKMQRQKQSDAAIAGIFGGGQQQQQPNLNSLPGGNIAQRLGSLGGQQQAPQSSQGMTPEQEQNIIQKTKGMTPEQIDQVLKSAEIPMNTKTQIYNILDKQRAAEFKERFHQENKASKEKTEAFKITAPYRAELAKESENSDHLVGVLKEMKKLSDSGKMTDTSLLEGLEKIGMDFNALKSPETEQYQALEKEFLKDLKSIFGGKVSNIEMQTFLRSIPKATNTEEGRKRIINQLDSYYKAKQLKFKAMRNIVKGNNGIPPLDLQDQVTEKIKSKEDKYLNKFRGGEKQPDPSRIKRYRDTMTGQIMVSNGKEFVPEGI